MKQPGYILVLTLMVTSILIIVVTGVFYNSIAQIAFTKTIVDREQAKILALSGIQLAIDKLTEEDEPIKNDSNKKENKVSSNDKSKILLKRILPNLNRWQTINLEEKNEGVDGQIKICITSENGKININKLFDYKKHKFLNDVDDKKELNKSNDFVQKDDNKNQEQKIIVDKPKDNAKLLLQNIFALMFEYTKSKDMFSELQSFLQKRRFPINDITELVALPKFSYFQDKMFYEPAISKSLKQPIYLTDIFTTWTDSEKIEPWLFSDSLCALLGLRRAKVNDEKEREQLVDEWLKNFNESNNWSIDWDKSLKTVYKKDFKNLSKNIQPFLSDKFAPKIFSVISYGTVGLITQRLVVILQIDSQDSNNNYTIRKLYWN